MQTPLILLADDDFEDRLLLKECFKENSIAENELHFVADGEEAINYLMEIKNPTAYPTLIVLDLNMPKLDGCETLKQLKATDKLRHIKVVILSTSHGDKDICMALGAVEYFIKPTRYLENLTLAKQLYSIAKHEASAEGQL